MNEPLLTVVGYLGQDPTLRFIQSGKAVASFNLASTPREKDGDQWKVGGTTWFAVSAWGEFAENVVESLHKGDRVIVTGRL